MMDRVRALPGVEGAGMSRAVPGDGYWGDNAFTVVEHPPLRQGVAQFAIDRETDAGFFQTMGIPILRGRSFDAGRSLDSAREAVINQAFQRSYFSNEDPIGKHLRYNDKDWEIVGVVGDTRYALNEAPKPIQYYSLYSGISNNTTLVIRANRDPEQYAMSVQRIVASLDPTLPVSDVLTMDQLLGKNTVDSSFNATLLGGFALLSLVLAAAGIFGVLSYVVTQRTSEIGIRMALGAGRGHVLSSVLADGLRPALFGLMLGLAGSVAAVRLLRSMLYETRPLDPTVFLFVSVGLIAVASFACLVPAWRASRLNPVEALRIS
jgi:predicted permease